jgi:hypothetical protein
VVLRGGGIGANHLIPFGRRILRDQDFILPCPHQPLRTRCGGNSVADRAIVDSTGLHGLTLTPFQITRCFRSILFYMPLAYANLHNLIEKISTLVNVALLCFEHCASLQNSLCK